MTHVIGRYPDGKGGHKYAVEVSDRGEPVYGVSEKDVKDLGFDPEKFTFQP